VPWSLDNLDLSSIDAVFHGCDQTSLHDLNIPLHVVTHTPRTSIPRKVIEQLQEWNVTRLFANIEYEVDELRRDLKVVERGRKVDIKSTFISDKLIVEPGKLTTQQGKQYAVSTTRISPSCSIRSY
jgi:deoxyribodipyrimidine photo-lyase